MRRTAIFLMNHLPGGNRLRDYSKAVRDKVREYRQHRLLRREGRALFNFWTVNAFQNAWLWRFLDRPRLREITTSKKIAFISVFGDPGVADRIQADAKVFYTGENLDFCPAYGGHLAGRVDLGLGFDYLDRPDYLRLPIWLLLCFTPEMELADIADSLRGMQQNRQNLLSRPRMEASLVASHDPSGTRAAMADLFTQVGRVHYGGRFRNPGPPLPHGWPSKLEYSRKFPFQICPENSARSGYVTEKIFQAIAAGCIPLYWGAAEPPEPAILNQEAILFYDPAHPEALLQRLQAISDDPRRLEGLRNASPFLDGAAETIYAHFLELEERLLGLL